MSISTIAALEALRSDLHLRIDDAFNRAAAQLSVAGPVKSVTYKVPSIADGSDPRNKNGLNLTPRGVEILYRLFDDGAGYNRAAKTLGITQGAAKNRKAKWNASGGASRTKLALDIDAA